ncbi:MAG TPA: diacylglycerol kinase family protein [Blastocatellia bacterium]|nr:diacylglycerol kinase family protein [Blastocatellia bacterium]
MSETLFIINPTSARGRTIKAWANARLELKQARLPFREHITSGTGEAKRVTREAVSAGVTTVIAVGGDGTMSEVVRGYLDRDGRAINPAAAVGLLPSGTGSDFRRSLGKTNIEDLIAMLGEGSTRLIDAVRASYTNQAGLPESRCFINLASFGLGGDIVKIVNERRSLLPRWVGGRARFVLGALIALVRYECTGTRVTLDDRPPIAVKSNLIVVANGKFAGGGMMLAPNADIADGLLDVILSDRAGRFDVIGELPRIGRGGLLKNPKVSEARAREVSIESERPLAIDIDGEMVGYTPATLRLLPGAVRFVA